uniref:Uncharacterized protein n=1 Tax=Glossina brevipalpis TaxID=37001 RepID=A0A1A9WX59_9MUSC
MAFALVMEAFVRLLTMYTQSRKILLFTSWDNGLVVAGDGIASVQKIALVLVIIVVVVFSHVIVIVLMLILCYSCRSCCCLCCFVIKVSMTLTGNRIMLPTTPYVIIHLTFCHLREFRIKTIRCVTRRY